MLGLGRHLESGDGAAAEDKQAWAVSDEARRFMTGSSQAWGAAFRAIGSQPRRDGPAVVATTGLPTYLRKAEFQLASVIDRLEHRYWNRATRPARVLCHLGCLSQYDVIPHRVSLGSLQFAGAHPQATVADLHVGRRGGAEVAKPVRIGPRSRAGAPHHESLTLAEVADAGRPRHTRPPPRGRDHQDVHVSPATGESAVEDSVHPHADAVSDPGESTLLGAHATSPAQRERPSHRTAAPSAGGELATQVHARMCDRGLGDSTVDTRGWRGGAAWIRVGAHAAQSRRAASGEQCRPPTELHRLPRGPGRGPGPATPIGRARLSTRRSAGPGPTGLR
jgi:hypothetical protein